MNLSFDLISDLHVETWDALDWTCQATSPYCIVAGDVARDRIIVKDTLQHLCQNYQAVFYIDGNDEHRWYYEDLGSSYRELADNLSEIKNLVYLQNNVAIIDGVAILGTNGWWTWDFNDSIDRDLTTQWFVDHVKSSPEVPDIISGMAQNDAAYLKHSIAKLQLHRDVKKIVVVTHTVPQKSLVDHDLELSDSFRFNCLGNSLMSSILEADIEKKISHWCFGHYHGDVDCALGQIRYVNNCKGRGDTPWKKSVYFPKRIEISI